MVSIYCSERHAVCTLFSTQKYDFLWHGKHSCRISPVEGTFAKEKKLRGNNCGILDFILAGFRAISGSITTLQYKMQSRCYTGCNRNSI